MFPVPRAMAILGTHTQKNIEYLRMPNGAQSWYFFPALKMENDWKPESKKKHLPALGKE